MADLIPNTNIPPTASDLVPPAPAAPVAPETPPLGDVGSPPVPDTPKTPETDSEFFSQFESAFESRYGISMQDFVQSTRYVQDNFQNVHQDYTTRYESQATEKLRQAWSGVEDYDARYAQVNEAFQSMSPELQQQWLAHGETIMPGYSGAGAAIAIHKALEERNHLQQQAGQVPLLDRNSSGGTGGKPVFKRSQLRDKRWLKDNNVTPADIDLAWQEGRVQNDI